MILAEVIYILTVIFLIASVVLHVLDMFSHPAIPAYIIAGVLSSIFIPQKEIMILAEIGIAFLVFIFGVKLDPERIESVAKESQLATSIQVLVVGITAYSLAKLMGYSHLDSLFFTVAASLSSSLVGMRLIESEMYLDLIHGRLAESIQLVQDMIAIVAVLTLTLTTFNPTTVLGTIIDGFTLIIIGLLIRWYIFDFIADLTDGSRELLMLVSISFLTGFVGIAQYMGISIVAGSFAAGLAVAKFPHNIEIVDTTGSLKDFFSAIFFIGLGALVSYPTPRVLLTATVLFLLVGALKPMVTAISLMLQGFDDRTAYLTGFNLDQISEFSLIIAIEAHIAGTLSDPLFHSVVMAATASMITSSYTSKHENQIYRLLSGLNLISSTRRKIENKINVTEFEDHVGVVGYGTEGKRVIEALKEEGQEFVVIENDPEKISEIKEKEEHYVFGDIMDQKTWNIAQLDEAKLVVSSVPNREVSSRMLDMADDTDLILGATDPEHASELVRKDATYVYYPEIMSSELIVEHVEGVLENEDYRDELREDSLREIRRYIEADEG
ncbi:MAG: cation:proton antiporter [Candidatus Nanohaloarchaea archaeon]